MKIVSRFISSDLGVQYFEFQESLWYVFSGYPTNENESCFNFENLSIRIEKGEISGETQKKARNKTTTKRQIILVIIIAIILL